MGVFEERAGIIHVSISLNSSKAEPCALSCQKSPSVILAPLPPSSQENLRTNCQLMEPLPALVSSLWTGNTTTRAHTHTRAHVASLTHSVICGKRREKWERMAVKWNKDHARLHWNLYDLFESNETLSQRAHEVFYLKFVFLFAPSIHSGFWQSRGHEEEVEIDGSAKGYVANCRVIGWTKPNASVSGWTENLMLWFWLRIKAGKCNYFKCSQHFCCSGGLPGFSINSVGYWHSETAITKCVSMCYCRCVKKMTFILSL